MKRRVLADLLREIPETDDCVEWPGPRGTTGGYGEVKYRYKNYKAHRLAYEWNVGPIPNDMFVCHSCDNPACYNPRHLWLGTALDNTRDMLTKGRHYWQKMTHCARGHEYTDENTYWRTDKPNSRMCRVCNRDKSRRRRLMGLT